MSSSGSNFTKNISKHEIANPDMSKFRIRYSGEKTKKAEVSSKADEQTPLLIEKQEKNRREKTIRERKPKNIPEIKSEIRKGVEIQKQEVSRRQKRTDRTVSRPIKNEIKVEEVVTREKNSSMVKRVAQKKERNV